MSGKQDRRCSLVQLENRCNKFGTFYLQSRSSCMYATQELDTTEDYLRVILFHPLSFSSVFFHHGNTNNLDIQKMKPKRAYSQAEDHPDQKSLE